MIGALFFLVQPALATGVGECRTGDRPEWKQVRQVHDGDSLVLSDQTKVRLIGVNTPELARDHRPAEPFAQAARKFAREQVNQAQGRIGLIYGKDRKDHYGRTLAHVILPDGSNLTARLLTQGMGSHVAISPNLRFSDCYAKAQQTAKQKQRNLWKAGRQQVINLDQDKTLPNGFQHIRGRVTRIGQGRHNIWLNFGDKLAIRIARQDLKYFSQWQPTTLSGKTIEASGWIYTAKGQQRMRVHHPSVIHLHEQHD
jgi:endonuclease YncB( thermonuclease family)